MRVEYFCHWQLGTFRGINDDDSTRRWKIIPQIEIVNSVKKREAFKDRDRHTNKRRIEYTHIKSAVTYTKIVSIIYAYAFDLRGCNESNEKNTYRNKDREDKN